MTNPTDQELNRMIRMDPGDSMILHLPNGKQRATGYTAEGPYDHADMIAAARRIYEQEMGGEV